jgi:plasmid stability protein
MPTTQQLVTITVDADLQRRLRRAASTSGRSVSRFVREILEARLRPARTHSGRCPLLRVAGIARGELSGLRIDDELYGVSR